MIPVEALRTAINQIDVFLIGGQSNAEGCRGFCAFSEPFSQYSLPIRFWRFRYGDK